MIDFAGCVVVSMMVLPMFASNPGPDLPMFVGAVSLISYYLAVEIKFGRTLGKIAMGMECKRVNEKGRISWGRWLARTFLRIVAFPICWLSWRRVSLLDLLTGIRVVRRGVPEPESAPVEDLAPAEEALGWR